MKNLRKICFAGLFCSLLLGISPAAESRAAEPKLARFEFSQVEMGAPFRILLYAADATQATAAAAAAYQRIGQLNRIMSDYDAESELSRLSAGSPQAQAVPISRDLAKVFDHAQRLAKDSDGAFDITVGPYVRLWRRARREKQMPPNERLTAARDAVGYDLLQFDAAASTARLSRTGMRLDLGGIAMGYAVDEALAELQQQGVRRALIDASGDVGVGDAPPAQAGWRIGIAPLTPSGPPSRYVTLANAAVTTSGDAFQFVEIDGQRYSHIVDPHTGLGLTDRSTVVAFAKDCMTADALATAVSVLGPTKGMALVEKIPGAAALILRKPGEELEIYETQRLKDLRIEPAKPE